MMKLAWCLVAHPDKLWVRIMRAKYKCGPNAVPEVRHRSNTSSTWRAISDVWEKVLGNLTWVIRDGLQTRFWKDSWIPHTGCRVEHVAASIPVGELNFSVSHYASNGCWRWDRLLNLLPSFICDRIATIKPALPGCADFPCWGATSDGNFTLKSAYESLFEEVGFDVSPTPIFQKAWEWKGPNHIRCFSGNWPMGGSLQMRRGNFVVWHMMIPAQDAPLIPSQLCIFYEIVMRFEIFGALWSTRIRWLGSLALGFIPGWIGIYLVRIWAETRWSGALSLGWQSMSFGVTGTISFSPCILILEGSCSLRLCSKLNSLLNNTPNLQLQTFRGRYVQLRWLGPLL